MGRPRQFDAEQALQKVKEAFWRYGYEGVSIRNLEEETGLNKQSLYRQFGSKRQMYRCALADYGQKEARSIEVYLQGPDLAPVRFGRVFDALIEGAGTELGRRGCFLCNASVDQAQSDTQTRCHVASLMEHMLELFESALADTEPYNLDSGARARKASELLAFYNGFCVLIKAGLADEILRDAVQAMLDSV